MAEINKPSISYEEKIYKKYINLLNEHGEEMEKAHDWNKVYKVLDEIYLQQFGSHDDKRLEIDDFLLHLFEQDDSTPSIKESEKKEYAYYGTKFLTTLDLDVHIDPLPPNTLPYKMVVVEMEPKALWQTFLLHNTVHFITSRLHD